MEIGSFASIIFEVSANKILTFEDFSRGGSARWSKHDILMGKPLPEFMGADQESVSLKIKFKSSLGVKPEDSVERLRAFRDQGKISTLVIGNKPVTNGFWYIEDMQEGHRTIDNTGKAHQIEVDLTLKEYPKKDELRAKPRTSASTKTASGAKRTAETGVVTVTCHSLYCRMSPSLSGKIAKVLKKNDAYKSYGTVKTDIVWYELGGGLYCSANSKYTSFKKR